MDCSTFSNKTVGGDTTLGEDGTGVVRRQLEAALKACETAQQELHETKRHYQTALDVQEHLSTELETQRLKEERRVSELTAKISTLQEELSNLRTEQTTVAEEHLQQIESFQHKIEDLKEQLALKTSTQNVPEEKPTNVTCDELVLLRNENNNLQSSVNEQRIKLDDKDVVIATMKEHLSDLQEKVTWSSEALERKKEELESVIEALHSAQSELVLANGELQRMKNEGTNHAAKGNSLFAEVEDKRQEMAKTLIQMKQNNMQLKRELVNKQAEIDSLLCEKKTLWEEVAGLSGVLDAEMIKNYEQRITTLQNLTDKQRREISRWLNKYYEPGSTLCAEWIGGLLSHLKNRCEQLTNEMLELSVDNLSKAEQIRDLHRKVATLRLKAFESNVEPKITHTDIKLEVKHVEIEIKPEKPEVKLEVLSSQENKENLMNVPKREKTVNDVKKKVTF